MVVPALGIDLAVGQLGLQANHQVQVPTTAHTVGWFRLGPTPGQVGSAVILGHVDSYRGPGVFFELKTLAVGAPIEVRRADGSVMEFRVTRVVEYPKSNFPDALVYGSSSGRYLNLVTCGGTFDHATGSYESNIVVFSRLVGVTGTGTVTK
ncbi:MAG: class F sortase [Acidobacteria bacterium]|nr:class F sortase [Acidobacteriota bacterium]